jgi:hypothetical protein
VDSVSIARQLWREKARVSFVLVVAVLAALLAAYRVSVSPPGLHQRELQMGAASSQILVDSRHSTLVSGATLGEFDALAARAKVYGEYLSSLEARAQIAAVSGVPARTITTSGPFSPDTGQIIYENQSSGSRANELLQEGAKNRLVFTAQEGVPILSVDAQASTAPKAIRLARASFITLRRYIRSLALTGSEDTDQGVIVRELGSPEGGTIGGSNDKILMFLAFVFVAVLGCALILIIPRVVHRWRSLDQEESLAVDDRVEPFEESGGEGAQPPQAAGDRESANGPLGTGELTPLPDYEPGDVPTGRATRR